MSDRRYDVQRYMRKDFKPRSSGMLDGDMAEKAVAAGVGVIAGGVLMHLAHKHNWFGMGARAATPAAAPAASAPASSSAPAASSTPASAGVRVVNIG